MTVHFKNARISYWLLQSLVEGGRKVVIFFRQSSDGLFSVNITMCSMPIIHMSEWFKEPLPRFTHSSKNILSVDGSIGNHF